jgi:glycosyltransferase involved in cell wall biosynthesis
LYALGLALSGKIFVQHRNQYAQLPGRWRAKSHVIPGVVAVPDTVEPHALRRPYVAWVGVLRQPKRPDRVVEIARACPTTEFVICGGVSDHRSPPGYGARMIEKFASVPNITYLGHVSPDRAIEVISGAALLVSTSEAEGFPSVFVEAWAHGTPVVTMEIDPDCVIERHGLGTTADSVEAAAAAITELVASAETRQAMARRARDYVSRTHAGPAVASLVAQALRSASAPTLRPFERAAKSRVFGNRSAGVASAEP